MLSAATLSYLHLSFDVNLNLLSRGLPFHVSLLGDDDDDDDVDGGGDDDLLTELPTLLSPAYLMAVFPLICRKLHIFP